LQLIRAIVGALSSTLKKRKLLSVISKESLRTCPVIREKKVTLTNTHLILLVYNLLVHQPDIAFRVT